MPLSFREYLIGEPTGNTLVNNGVNDNKLLVTKMIVADFW